MFFTVSYSPAPLFGSSHIRAPGGTNNDRRSTKSKIPLRLYIEFLTPRIFGFWRVLIDQFGHARWKECAVRPENADMRRKGTARRISSIQRGRTKHTRLPCSAGRYRSHEAPAKTTGRCAAHGDGASRGVLGTLPGGANRRKQEAPLSPCSAQRPPPPRRPRPRRRRRAQEHPPTAPDSTPPPGPCRRRAWPCPRGWRRRRCHETPLRCVGRRAIT